jgi:WD40 repeat protein
MREELLLLEAGKSISRMRGIERRLRITTRVAVAVMAVMVLGVVPYYLAIKEARRAKASEAEAKDKLWSSYLAQAQAGRWSHRMGRRFDGLEALRKAAEIRPTLELRNEAIACLALPDLRKQRELPKQEPGYPLFDAACERYVCGGDTNGSIIIRAAADAKQLARLPGPGAEVHETYFSPDGRLLAVSYLLPNRPLFLWDLASKMVVFKPPITNFRALDFAADSSRIAIAQEGGSILIYDLPSRRQLQSFDPGYLPYWVAFDPLGRRLAVSSHQTRRVDVWDTASGQIIRSFPLPGNALGLAWSPSGDLLAATCADSCIHVWSSVTGELYRLLTGHESAPVRLQFSPEAELLGSTGYDGQLRLWNMLDGAEVCRAATAGWFVRWSKDGRRLAYQPSFKVLGLAEVASGHECRFLEIEEPSLAPVTPGLGPAGQVLTAKAVVTGASSLSFDPSGQLLTSSHTEGVRFWDARTGALVDFKPARDTHFVKFEPAGNSLLVGRGAGIERWPISIPSSGPPMRIEVGAATVIDYDTSLGRHGVFGLDAAGTTLAAVADGKAHVLGLNGRAQKQLVFSDKPVGFATLSANGRWCAAANTEAGAPPTSVVYVAEVGTGKVLSTLPAPGVTAVAFSPNDRWLAVGGYTQYWLLDTRSWQCFAPIQRDLSSDLPASLTFSPDSRTLAIAWSARAVRLIEPSTHRQIATLESPEPVAIGCLTFSPDGTQLAVGRWDHLIALWDLRLIRKELASMKLDWDLPPYP